jgi:hypothetical protein
VGLKKVIGSPVGTVIWDDLQETEAFFFFGQNTGSNSPRFLHPLQDAVKRGAKIVTFNPVRERGLETFVNPQNVAEMLTDQGTEMSCQYRHVRQFPVVARQYRASNLAINLIKAWMFFNAAASSC